MSELKPCPFCGGKARMLTKQTQTNDSEFFREWKYEYIIKCNRCKASIGHYQSKKTAEIAWNRRKEGEQK